MNELKHFGNSMFGPDKDVCQTCGNESNTMYWKNGVCQSCQEKKYNANNGLDITKPFLKVLTMMMFLVAIIEFALNLVTFGFYSKWMSPNTLMNRLGRYIMLKERE